MAINQDNIDALFNIREKCKSAEYDVLRFYCECMIKLCRTFYKIEKTEMLSYVKRIMQPAYPLMVRYFLHQAEAYIGAESEKKRLEILEDIENSVMKFWEVQEAIIQSGNSADRILFQTAPIDMGSHYAAPKLCAYYSELLNAFACIFDEDSERQENPYAFCVYPTLNSRAEAECLFTTMEERGKVVVIRVPGKDIADVQYITSLLLHEFFHISTASLRLREKRAKLFLNILLYDIEAILTKSIVLSGKEEQEKLRAYLFDGVTKTIKEKIKDHSSNDRFFYSRDIKEFYANEMIRHLCNIRKKSALEMAEQIYPLKQSTNFQDYNKKRGPIKKWHAQLNTNILDLCVSQTINRKCEFYMGIFREAYADLLCVISLRLSPEKYFSTFHYMKKKADKSGNHINLFLRVFLVKEVMAEKLNENVTGLATELFKMWNEWSEEYMEEDGENDLIDAVADLTNIFKQESRCTPEKEENWPIDREYVETVPNKVILRRYLSYFKECRNEYLLFINKHQDKYSELQKRFMLSGDMENKHINCSISFREWEIIDNAASVCGHNS